LAVARVLVVLLIAWFAIVVVVALGYVVEAIRHRR
jgi:hypothetical protein